MSKPNETENKHTDTKIRVMITRGGVGVYDKIDKGDQFYGDGQKLNLWW